MAEVLAEALAAFHGHEVEVQSASLLGLKDHPAHKHAIQVMTEKGLNLSNHLATPLSGELMDWADHVLCMEVEQAVEMRKRFPDGAPGTLRRANGNRGSPGGLASPVSPLPRRD